eukprot:48326_1
MGTAVTVCTPIGNDEDTKDEKDEKDEYSIDTSKPRALTLLDLWANKPGFYSEAYFARIMYKDYFDTQKPNKTDTTAKDIVLNWTRVTAYIAGADKLSKTERDLLIPSEQIWSGYTASVKEITNAIDEGLNMTEKEALDFANTLANDHGTDTNIAKSMGVKQSVIDQIIGTYLLEIKFSKQLYNLLGTAQN